MQWLNKGLAPAYETYQLNGKLVKKDSMEDSIIFTIPDSGNKKCIPGMLANERYAIPTEKISKGTCMVFLKLFDVKSGRLVEPGLAAENRESNGFYYLGDVDL